MRALSTGLGIVWLSVFAGCQTTSVPAVSPAMAALGAGRGATLSSLQNGRTVLASRCISCHGITPIGQYSVGEWKVYVDKMAPRAKLSEIQQRDLLAYLTAAREGIQQP